MEKSNKFSPEVPERVVRSVPWGIPVLMTNQAGASMDAMRRDSAEWRANKNLPSSSG